MDVTYLVVVNIPEPIVYDTIDHRRIAQTDTATRACRVPCRLAPGERWFSSQTKVRLASHQPAPPV